MAKANASTAPASAPAAQPAALWTFYDVTWRFITRLCSSVPADPAIIKKWLEAREPRVKPAGALSIEEINEEVLASIERGEGEPDQTFNMLVFQRHAEQLVMRYGTVKAHLKDCARVISAQFIGKIEGERAFSTRITNGVYLDPAQYWLPIQRFDGTPIREADGAFDKAVRVYVPGRGQMSALKRFEYVEPPSMLRFRIMVLGRSVSETDLHHLFSYGGVHGYAGERGDGEGRYTYEFARVEAPRERAAAADGGRDHREA